jgi:hypothetical protein
MLKTRIQICIADSISYLFEIKKKNDQKTDYRINTVFDRFHSYYLSLGLSIYLFAYPN